MFNNILYRLDATYKADNVIVSVQDTIKKVFHVETKICAIQ